MYINPENVSVLDGNGTEASPYKVDNGPRVAISSDKKYVSKGDSITLSTIATNIPDDAVIKYFFNGNEVATLDDTFALNKVTNIFEAVILSNTGAELGRSRFFAYTVLIEEERHLRTFDFEGETPLAGLSVSGTGTNNELMAFTDGVEGSALTFTSNALNQPTIVSQAASGLSGDFVIETDIRFDEINESTSARNIILVRPRKGTSSASFIYPLEFTKDGDIKLSGSVNPRTIDVNYEEGKWYHLLISINSERKVYTVMFDGKLLCAEEEMANKDFDNFSYVTIGPGRCVGGVCTISFDNLELYMANDTPRIILSGDYYGVMGDSVKVSSDSYRIDENSKISYFYNGKLVPTLDGEFVLKYLSNNFTAVVKDKDSVETSRSEFVVHHPYFYKGDELAVSDFEDEEKPLGDLRMGGSLTVDDVGFENTKYGKSLNLTSTVDKQPFATTSAMNGKKGDIVIDADFCFDKYNTTVASRGVFGLRTTNNGVSSDFVYPVEFTDSRDIRIPFCETPYVVDVNLEDGRWYHITMVINPERKDITVVLDDKLLCAREKITSTQFDNISYMNFGPGRVRSGECIFLIDNFNMYVADEPCFEYMFDDKGFKVVNKNGVVSDAVIYFVKNGAVAHISTVNFANGESEKHVDEDLSNLDLGSMEIFIWSSNLKPLDRVTGIGR